MCVCGGGGGDFLSYCEFAIASFFSMCVGVNCKCVTVFVCVLFCQNCSLKLSKCYIRRVK